MTSALHEVGLDEPLHDGATLNDILVSDQESPTTAVSRTILKEQIRTALSSLKPKYEKVIRLRFGIGESSDHTLEDIGRHLGLTKERIRQIEKRALSQISKKRI
jgi:RNA polymerase primary sigma factor